MAAADTYPVGECTYYVATRFPAIYGYMGNGGQWINSAIKQGYPVLRKPLPDTIAVFVGPGYSPIGHVAVVDSVNADGSYNVSEMNYAGWDQVDQRRVQPGQELGFIVPPGSMLTAGGANTIPASYLTASGTGGNCDTSWTISLGPWNTVLCMDGVIGGAAIAAGGALMLAGVMILVALAISGSKIGKKTTGALAAGASPVGAVVQHQQQQKAKAIQRTEQDKAASKQAEIETHEQAMRRSQLRISRARARVAESRAKQAKAPVVRMSAEDKERAAERRIASTGKRPEPGTVRRGLEAA